MHVTWTLVIVPLGLGLLGFIEPCTIGSSLLWLKYVERKSPGAQRFDTVVFAITRSVFIGGLGALAAGLGSRFLVYQRGFWVGLGLLYVVIGAMYLLRREWLFVRAIGPTVARARTRNSVALGVLFGLNIPACAAPLLAALLAASVGVANVGRGFLAMAVFGLALSLPLVAAVWWTQGRTWIERLTAISHRVPVWTGVVFLLLGVWSIRLGFTPASEPNLQGQIAIAIPHVPGPYCAYGAEKRLRDVPGVRHVHADWDAERIDVTLSGDARVTPADLDAAMTRAEYPTQYRVEP